MVYISACYIILSLSYMIHTFNTMQLLFNIIKYQKKEPAIRPAYLLKSHNN